MSLISIGASAVGGAGSSTKTSSVASGASAAGKAASKSSSSTTVSSAKPATSTTASKSTTSKSAISAGAAAVSLVAGGSSSDSSAVTKTISAAGLAASGAASSTGGAGKGAPSKSSIAAGGSAVGVGTSGSSAFAAAQAYSKGTAFAGGAMATGGAAAAQSGGWAAALGPFLAMGGAALGFYLVGTGPAGRGEDELVRKLGLGTGSGVAVNANEKTPDQKPIAGDQVPTEKPAETGAIGVKAARKGAPPVPDATPGRVTSGRSAQWDKAGTFEDANKDFDNLNPTDVKTLDGGKRIGTLSDGRTIVVRPKSSSGDPTIEIQNDKYADKVRYINK